jgi:hypothetical protein
MGLDSPISRRGIRPIAVALVVLVALTVAASASAQGMGSSLELSGVPATLTLPGNFTLTVIGSTGLASNAAIYAIYGPAPCAASVEAQLGAGPSEFLASAEAAELPPFGFAGSFAVHVPGIGDGVTSPGEYSVCVFMEAPSEPEAVETPEEDQLIAVASAGFTVLPSLTGSAPAGVSGRLGHVHPGAPRCIVPHLRGRRLPQAIRSIVRAHCAVGKLRRARSTRIRRGRVVLQSRHVGRQLPRGTKVGLVISDG